ncbi:MAG: YihY/virulence factor BrkB family protein [Tepidisphaeraceae bacterium]
MAKLRDVRPVLRSVGAWTFTKRLFQQIGEDNVMVWASALAYSWLFAIFPFLILLLSLVPYLPQHARDTARASVSQFVHDTLGKAAPTINDNINSVLNEPRHGWLWLGLIFSLWVASGGMAMTMSALDKCYDLKISPPFYKQRPFAMLLTILVTALVILVFLLLPVGLAAKHLLEHFHVLSPLIILGFDILRYVIAIMVMLMTVALIYHFGPSIHQPFRLVTPGSIFSVTVWVVLDLVFRTYIDRYARYDQTYGTVGGAAILLLFFYIVAVVLLIGAEINSKIDMEILQIPPGSNDYMPKLSVVPKPGASLPNQLGTDTSPGG